MGFKETLREKLQKEKASSLLFIYDVFGNKPDDTNTQTMVTYLDKAMDYIIETILEQIDNETEVISTAEKLSRMNLTAESIIRKSCGTFRDIDSFYRNFNVPFHIHERLDQILVIYCDQKEFYIQEDKSLHGRGQTPLLYKVDGKDSYLEESSGKYYSVEQVVATHVSVEKRNYADRLNELKVGVAWGFKDANGVMNVWGDSNGLVAAYATTDLEGN